ASSRRRTARVSPSRRYLRNSLLRSRRYHRNSGGKAPLGSLPLSERRRTACFCKVIILPAVRFTTGDGGFRSEEDLSIVFTSNEIGRDRSLFARGVEALGKMKVRCKLGAREDSAAKG